MARRLAELDPVDDPCLAPRACDCGSLECETRLSEQGARTYCLTCRRELRFYALDMSPKSAPAVAYCQAHDPKWTKKEGTT
jgi:hypothetical protein